MYRKPPCKGKRPSPGQGDSVDRHGAAALGIEVPAKLAAPPGQDIGACYLALAGRRAGRGFCNPGRCPGLGIVPRWGGRKIV